MQAYAPFIQVSPDTFDFTGPNIFRVAGQWRMDQPADYPAQMGFEYAARFANWLHNDKALTPSAFESGVYDTSTFSRNPDGSFNHNTTHSSDARFWIPTRDEWIKGAHWDPAKNGGQGGYWLYPTTSDTAPVSGTPEAGGQTTAGENGIPGPVNQYPNVTSPWGLLNTSGGMSEWTGSIVNPFLPVVFTGGSGTRDIIYEYTDALNRGGNGAAWGGLRGLRLASIPPPPVAGGAVFVALFLLRNRRQR